MAYLIDKTYECNYKDTKLYQVAICNITHRQHPLVDSRDYRTTHVYIIHNRKENTSVFSFLFLYFLIRKKFRDLCISFSAQLIFLELFILLHNSHVYGLTRLAGLLRFV